MTDKSWEQAIIVKKLNLAKKLNTKVYKYTLKECKRTHHNCDLCKYDNYGDDICLCTVLYKSIKEITNVVKNIKKREQIMIDEEYKRMGIIDKLHYFTTLTNAILGYMLKECVGVHHNCELCKYNDYGDICPCTVIYDSINEVSELINIIKKENNL